MRYGSCRTQKHITLIREKLRRLQELKSATDIFVAQFRRLCHKSPKFNNCAFV